MTTNDPAVIPMIAYEDGPAAMDWLSRAFGFKERARMVDRDGRLTHGEMEVENGLIMLATPSPHYEGPRHHREHCEAAQRWSTVPYVVDGYLVYVKDLDAHFQRASAAGALILTPLESSEHGKRYRAEDLEGHRWMFIERQA